MKKIFASRFPRNRVFLEVRYFAFFDVDLKCTDRTQTSMKHKLNNDHLAAKLNYRKTYILLINEVSDHLTYKKGSINCPLQLFTRESWLRRI